MIKIKNRKIIIVLTVLAIMWILHTVSKNFITDPTFASFLSQKDTALNNESLWIFMIQIHIVLAVVALMTGPIGLSRKIRRKSLRFHRWNGRVYTFSIFLNFFPGLYVSFFASGGWPSIIGFLILNTLWFITTLLGIIYARKKAIVKHREWIIRSFFLTFANMTIYILVAISQHVFGLPYGTSYSVAVWGSWIINLLLAEWFIRRNTSVLT